MRPRLQLAVKHLIDFVAGAAGLLILLLMTPAVWLGHLITGDPGPPIYRQKRVGRDGKVFTILKFRTMRAAPGGRDYTLKGDDRITRFGRVLRTAGINELPQLLNVLMRQMSLVGPRPHTVAETAWLERAVPGYAQRLDSMRPGMTGWAVIVPDRLEVTDENSRLEWARRELVYDRLYRLEWSLGLDLRIMRDTVRWALRSVRRCGRRHGSKVWT